MGLGGIYNATTKTALMDIVGTATNENNMRGVGWQPDQISDEIISTYPGISCTSMYPTIVVSGSGIWRTIRWVLPLVDIVL